VRLGIGDDCALLKVAEGDLLAISMDTLVSGVHFFADVDPEALGHKALAVNLSDLAAMGAVPAWATLSLTLPQYDPQWLEFFSRGFRNLADRFGVQLVGGDTCRGPLSITVQVHGLVGSQAALRRDAARVGDLIYVTGELGSAALVVEWLRGQAALPPEKEVLRGRLERPEPRVAEALALAPFCNAAIDLSDGLISDLGHICKASGAGARIELSRLPMHSLVRRQVAESGDWWAPLAGGDDYELCLTVPMSQQVAFEAAAAGLSTPVTPVGEIVGEPGIVCLGEGGEPMSRLPSGYDHFADD